MNAIKFDIKNPNIFSTEDYDLENKFKFIILFRILKDDKDKKYFKLITRKRRRRYYEYILLSSKESIGRR